MQATETLDPADPLLHQNPAMKLFRYKKSKDDMQTRNQSEECSSKNLPNLAFKGDKKRIIRYTNRHFDNFSFKKLI
jgi:hypothetical protein